MDATPIVQLPLNTALVTVADLVRSHDKAFSQGYNKGVFFGVVGTATAIYVYNRLKKARPSIFNLKQERKS